MHEPAQHSIGLVQASQGSPPELELALVGAPPPPLTLVGAPLEPLVVTPPEPPVALSAPPLPPPPSTVTLPLQPCTATASNIETSSQARCFMAGTSLLDGCRLARRDAVNERGAVVARQTARPEKAPVLVAGLALQGVLHARQTLITGCLLVPADLAAAVLAAARANADANHDLITIQPRRVL